MGFKHYCTSLLAALVVACTDISPQEQALNDLITKFSREIEHDYGFHLCGAGSSMPEKIEVVRLYFLVDSSGYLEGARHLAVGIALKLVDQINQDIQLRPYLETYPASVKNISLTLGFNQENEENLNQNNCLSSVMVIAYRGLVCYNIYDETGMSLIDLHKETFEEAKAIVDRERGIDANETFRHSCY